MWSRLGASTNVQSASASNPNSKLQNPKIKNSKIQTPKSKIQIPNSKVKNPDSKIKLQHLYKMSKSTKGLQWSKKTGLQWQWSCYNTQTLRCHPPWVYHLRPSVVEGISLSYLQFAVLCISIVDIGPSKSLVRSNVPDVRTIGRSPEATFASAT